MPRLCGSLFRRTMGVLPICWVTVSITTGGSLGCVRVDMVDVGVEADRDFLESWRIEKVSVVRFNHAGSVGFVAKALCE